MLLKATVRFSRDSFLLPHSSIQMRKIILSISGQKLFLQERQTWLSKLNNFSVRYFLYRLQNAITFGSLEKTDAGRDRGQEKGTTEDEMTGWHHRLNGCEFE